MKTASKITPEQAAEARRRYAAGESVGAIARTTGLTWIVAVKLVDPDRHAEWAAKERSRFRSRRGDAPAETPKPVDLDAAKATWNQDVGQPWIEDRRVRLHCHGAGTNVALRIARGLPPKAEPKPEPPPELRGVSDAIRLYELRTAREFSAALASIRTVLSDEALQAIGSTEDTE